MPSIGLFDVVEHIENDLNFLTQMHRFLKDDGLIFITVPAYDVLWSKDDEDAGHFRRYTTKELENKLKAAGFTIEYSTYIFSILPIAVFLFRTLPNKMGLNQNSSNLKKQRNEHIQKKGIVNKILDYIWEFELNKIRKGKKILFGGSCFVIGRKIN